MQDSRGLTYRDAGVDIDAGDELVERMAMVRRTQRPEVRPGRGSRLTLQAQRFGNRPSLAIMAGPAAASHRHRHDRIGTDLVAMCVNDVAVQARSLVFLTTPPQVTVDVALSHPPGIATCRQALVAARPLRCPDV
jgi:phosphoribosylformylglycinamidine cyclo-ligase